MALLPAVTLHAANQGRSFLGILLSPLQEMVDKFGWNMVSHGASCSRAIQSSGEML